MSTGMLKAPTCQADQQRRNMRREPERLPSGRWLSLHAGRDYAALERDGHWALIVR
jgi:hypothetical protein